MGSNPISGSLSSARVNPQFLVCSGNQSNPGPVLFLVQMEDELSGRDEFSRV
ncbi:MAG: hypothetical protein GY698_24625 [Actinomycetia bacterium]|nr:hypothetical protein [Actinomycetes bacterium]